MKVFQNSSTLHYLVENGAIFNRKLEPLKWIHFLVGMTSCRVKGQHLKKGTWWASLYLFCLSIVSIVYVIRATLLYFSNKYGVTLLNIAEVCVFISSLAHLVANWILNINSNIVINIVKKFDYVEKALPKINAFVYNSNNFNKMIHIVEITYLCVYKIVCEKGKFPLLEMFFTTLCNIALGFSVFQVCIMVNM